MLCHQVSKIGCHVRYVIHFSHSRQLAHRIFATKTSVHDSKIKCAIGSRKRHRNIMGKFEAEFIFMRTSFYPPPSAFQRWLSTVKRELDRFQSVRNNIQHKPIFTTTMYMQCNVFPLPMSLSYTAFIACFPKPSFSTNLPGFLRPSSIPIKLPYQALFQMQREPLPNAEGIQLHGISVTAGFCC